MPQSTKIALSSGSPLMGSPVVFQVLAENLSGQSNMAFHRVILEVKVGVVGESTMEAYKLSIPVKAESSSNYLLFDISEALQAKDDDYEYTPHTGAGTITYPVYKVQLKAWDEYMKDGQFRTTTAYTLGTNYYFLQGAFTNMERMASTVLRGVNTLTRKPLTGEVILDDGLYVYPTPNYAYTDSNFFEGNQPNAPTSIAVSIANLSGTIGGRSIYKDANAENCYAFQFVNGYGVVESAFAYCLPDKEIPKKVSEYDVTGPTAFNQIGRHVTRKTASRHRLKMSSGPVTMEWQEWWQEEFLNTMHAWMLYKGTWVPVSIVPDDTTKGIDLADDDLPSVEFTVKMDFDGV